MPLYEHVFLVRQEISPAQVEALTKEYSEVIESQGGKVGKTEYWGLKTLAYKIKKNRKAHYALMNIDAPPAAVQEMERRMRLSPDVIRFLTVRVDEHQTEPSVQMRKGDRDERRGEREGERGRLRGERGGLRGPRSDRPPRAREREEGEGRTQRESRPAREREEAREDATEGEEV
jgi:small subunit ribosomal protein S6